MSTTAIATASYKGDFERCRLLCETVDQWVEGYSKHYLLVEDSDYNLFRPLADRRREVVLESDLLPSWLRAFPDPFSLGRRRIWLSTKTRPLRGWHTQQLRRIALASHVEDEGLFYCDSDVAFFRPFSCTQLWEDGKMRLYRNRDALLRPEFEEQRAWTNNADQALGLETEEPALHDYIDQLISWRRDDVLSMCARIEAAHNRHWIAVLGNQRGHFSECIVYGRYIDEAIGLKDHFHDETGLSHVLWTHSTNLQPDLGAFINKAEPHHVALGVQSFVGADVDDIRRAIAAHHDR